MLVRGGPWDGRKVDGRRVRGARFEVKIGANEFASYERNPDGIFEFVGAYHILLRASPAGRRVEQLRRRGMSYEDALAQAKRENLEGTEGL
jgi:hypothetical protein